MIQSNLKNENSNFFWTFFRIIQNVKKTRKKFIFSLNPPGSRAGSGSRSGSVEKRTEPEYWSSVTKLWESDPIIPQTSEKFYRLFRFDASNIFACMIHPSLKQHCGGKVGGGAISNPTELYQEFISWDYKYSWYQSKWCFSLLMMSNFFLLTSTFW